MVRAAIKFGHISDMSILATVIDAVPGVGESLKVFRPLEVEKFLNSSSQRKYAIEQASSVSFKGLLQRWPDLSRYGQELPSFTAGQDYRLDSILEWQAARPDYARKDLTEDFTIAGTPHWLRTLAMVVQAHYSTRTTLPLFNFIRKAGNAARSNAAKDLRRLASAIEEVEDITQAHDTLIIMPMGNRLFIRPASFLASGLVGTSTDPARVTAATLGATNAISGFSAEAIAELEDLVNSTSARESDFQAFFEENPQFLLGVDYQRAVPHPVLRREDDPDLIPDFILLPHAEDSRTPKIVDLKLPRVNLVRRKTNRLGYLASVQEAHDQLVEYRNYFADPARAREARALMGTEVFMPDICVVIGRSSAFGSNFERQRVRATAPGLELLTYDDVLAKSRRLVS
ncbi:uncharacterized protein DUF4263 [Saccharothrix texasensis]|uniref:Uncharacterized protein DUF4263 n=2 Tax=Saccharothrix texasensis TaxID=103734 RepID=A0A3N1HCA5_9PSEU|nr:uncharacterized protein DUF4263 [Saccharothrix texasensis]